MSYKIIALDLEGTLITNSINRRPRNCLRPFLHNCQDLFERVVILTGVDRKTTREILEELAEKEYISPANLEGIEILEWEGEYKDLSSIPGARDGEALIVDDDPSCIHPDQVSQWVPIKTYDPPGIDPWIPMDEQLPEDDQDRSRFRTRYEMYKNDDDDELLRLIGRLKKILWLERKEYLNTLPNCFEWYLIEDPPGSGSLRYHLLPDGEANTEQVFEAKYESLVFFIDRISELVTSTQKPIWATVVFEKTYRLAGHIMAARKSKEEISFANLDASTGKDRLDGFPEAPAVGVVLIHDKAALERLEGTSPFFGILWSLLEDKPADRCWLCFPPELPRGWVSEVEMEDEALFQQHYQPPRPADLTPDGIDPENSLYGIVISCRSIDEVPDDRLDSARALMERALAKALQVSFSLDPKAAEFYLEKLDLMLKNPIRKSFAYLRAARMLEGSGRIQGAARLYQLGLDLNPQHPPLLFQVLAGLAFCRLQEGYLQEAEGLISRASQVYPGQQKIYFLKGLLQERRGDLPAAAAAYLAGLDAPILAREYLEYARDLIFKPALLEEELTEKTSFLASAGDAEAVLLPAPARLLGLLFRHFTLNGLKPASIPALISDPGTAEQNWKDLYGPLLEGMAQNQAQPDPRPGLNYKGLLNITPAGDLELTERGRSVLADHFQLKIRWNQPDLNGYLTPEGLWLTDDYLEAAESYKDSLRKLINYCFDYEIGEKAQPYIDQLLALSLGDEERAQRLIQCGIWKEKLEDYQAAIQCYAEGLALDPQGPEHRYYLRNNTGYCCNMLGQFKEAEPWCRKAIGILPEYFNAYKNLGMVLRGQGRSLEAAESFREAILIAPGDRRAYEYLVEMARDDPDLTDQVPDLGDLIDQAGLIVENYFPIRMFMMTGSKTQFDELIPELQILVGITALYYSFNRETFYPEEIVSLFGDFVEGWDHTWQDAIDRMSLPREEKPYGTKDPYRGILQRTVGVGHELTDYGLGLISFLERELPPQREQ